MNNTSQKQGKVLFWGKDNKLFQSLKLIIENTFNLIVIKNNKDKIIDLRQFKLIFVSPDEISLDDFIIQKEHCYSSEFFILADNIDDILDYLNADAYAYINDSFTDAVLELLIKRALEHRKQLLENLRLHRRVNFREEKRENRTTQVMEILMSISEEIVFLPPLRDFLSTILNRIASIFSLEAGEICLLNDMKELETYARYLKTKRTPLLKALDAMSNVTTSILQLNENDEKQFGQGISIPLRGQNHPLGLLNLIASPNNPLDKLDMDMLTVLTHQIAMSVENIRLYLQRDKRIEELSTLGRIGQFLISDMHLKNLLREILDLAKSLIKVEAGSLLLLDEKHHQLVFEVVQDKRSPNLEGMRLSIDEGITGWVARKGKPIIVAKVKDDYRFYNGIDKMTKFSTESMLCVPLKLKNKVIGVIALMNKTDGASFTEEDKKLLSSIAAQASIAIENARLYGELRYQMHGLKRQVTELSGLAELSKEIGFLSKSKDVLPLIRNRLQEILVCPIIALFLIQPEERAIIRYEAEKYVQQEQLEKITKKLLHYWSRLGNRYVDSNKVTVSINWFPAKYTPLYPEKLRTKSHLLAPLVAFGNVFGMLAIYNFEENFYNEDDLWTFFTATGLIASALRNMDLVNQLKDNIGELKKTNRELKDVQSKLIESEKITAIGQIAVTLNHAINNPLCGILLEIELLKIRFKKDNEVLSRLETIEKAGNRIKNALQKLTKIKKAETTSYTGSIQMIDLEASSED